MLAFRLNFISLVTNGVASVGPMSWQLHAHEILAGTCYLNMCQHRDATLILCVSSALWHLSLWRRWLKGPVPQRMNDCQRTGPLQGSLSRWCDLTFVMANTSEIGSFFFNIKPEFTSRSYKVGLGCSPLLVVTHVLSVTWHWLLYPFSYACFTSKHHLVFMPRQIFASRVCAHPPSLG